MTGPNRRTCAQKAWSFYLLKCFSNFISNDLTFGHFDGLVKNVS